MRYLSLIAALSLALAAPAIAQDHTLPDPTLTPGAVLQVTADQVCVPGYSKSARHVTQGTRDQVFAVYGVPDGNHTGYCSGDSGCELDHLISLELGGSNEAVNLWPEPYDGPWNARDKDRVENRLHRMVCDGEITLDQAQREIAADWIGAYRRYVGEPTAER